LQITMRHRDNLGNPMNSESHRPTEHQQVIALLKEAQAPPADSETPSIPDELLDRLRGQYGRAPRRVIVEDKPSVWAWLCELFVQPRLAFAMALVLVCGLATVLLRAPQPQQGEELLRGGQPNQTAALAYWLQSDKGEPAPKGLGLPKFIVITLNDPLPVIGDALIFDPAHREARAMKDGRITTKIPVADPTDSNEWLSVHRQLRKLP
jgi:hypothetical protein